MLPLIDSKALNKIATSNFIALPTPKSSYAAVDEYALIAEPLKTKLQQRVCLGSTCIRWGARLASDKR